MDTRELTWLAGLLEGEGCFGRSGGTARVTLAMTDEDVVTRAARILRAPVVGPVQPSQKRKDGGTRKPVYSASVYGSRAAGWMMTLYTLMGSRRQAKILESLVAWKATRCKNPSGAGRRNPRSPSERR